MKIVFLSTGLNVGGAEIMLYNLLSKIDRDRFKPIVVSLVDRGIYGDKIAKLDIPVQQCQNVNGQTFFVFAQAIHLDY